MKFLKAYLAAAVAFLVIDLAWISLFLSNVYDAELGSMLLASPRVSGAVLFYVGYVAAVVFLAVRPGLRAQKAGVALGHGGCLGAVAYGTYTLTNFALFEPWSLLLVVSDIAWGSFLTALSALAGYAAARQ